MMQNVAPVINQARGGGTLRLAFLSAVVSLVASFAAASAPIPLYNIYRAEDGFTNAGISMAVVAYAVGTIAALLGLGRLSNHLGRRLTAIASLGRQQPDLLHRRRRAHAERLASVVSSQRPMFSLTVGGIASGALVQFGPWPRDPHSAVTSLPRCRAATSINHSRGERAPLTLRSRPWQVSTHPAKRLRRNRRSRASPNGYHSRTDTHSGA